MPNFFDQHIQNIQDWEIGTYENCEFSGLDFKHLGGSQEFEHLCLALNILCFYDD